MAGERPTDPHLFNEWGALLRPAEHADVVQMDRVRDAIESLPARQRDVINGLFYEGCTKTVIADRLGVSRHEVRRLMLEAFASLQATLAEV